MRPIKTVRRPAAALLLALLAVFTTPTDARQRRVEPARAPAPVAQTKRPRLVLLIAVDQFRYDYLERFGDLFGAGGLRRLLRDGASWAECNFDHVPTETAPGHATMMTGAWPSETGIIANLWFDRVEGKSVENVRDDSVRPLGGGERESPASPRNLLASTLGDQLKMATAGRARVVGVSSKNRGAILPAGRMADGAYWYSTQTGQFVSSTYYFDSLPDWAARFNAARPADKFFGAKWERLLALSEYERRAGRDDAPWEKGTDNRSHVFPHVVDGGLKEPGPAFYGSLDYSPYSNDLVLSFAEAALVNERLGADEDTDVLTVSFSANDIVGHRYGPYSHEAMDITLRTDRQIARLLEVVDARVGLGNTVVAFTADHGVAPSPEHAVEMGLPGGRVRPADIQTAVRNRVRARFGKPGDKDTTADYVQTFSNYQVYFNRAALDRDGISVEEIERVAGEAALTVPGVSRYFTRTQLLAGAVSPDDALARRVLHGYSQKRSGDVVVIQEPYKYISSGTGGATHGTPYVYDTHVPLIIMGGGVAPGRYLHASTPADIAPTLARLLSVEPPSNSAGRVLSEAIK